MFLNYQNQDLNTIKNELKKYLIHLDSSYFIKEYGCEVNSISLYRNLFSKPVEQIFFWKEEAYSGSLFVVFKYNNKFISIYGSFGCCVQCDFIEGTGEYNEIFEKVNKIFNSIEIHNSFQDIHIPHFYHPQLKYKFSRFQYDNYGFI